MEKIKQEQLFMNTRTVAQKAAPKKEAPKVKTVEKKTKQ